MPVVAALTINDGAATPVAHTYSPASQEGTLVKWADRSPSIPAGFRTVQHQYEEPKGQRTVHRITIGFYQPVVATVNSVDTVVRFSSGSIQLNLSPDSTLQERKDLLATMANALGLAGFKTSVENLEPYY
jgi:hypothetical protein